MRGEAALSSDRRKEKGRGLVSERVDVLMLERGQSVGGRERQEILFSKNRKNDTHTAIVFQIFPRALEKIGQLHLQLMSRDRLLAAWIEFAGTGLPVRWIGKD